MADVFGVDLSHHNSISNYATFRNAIDFIYIKVTESTYQIDPAWRTHHDGTAGKLRAPYHFMGQRGNFPAQVRAFLATYRQASWEWGPVLDVEFNASVQSGSPVSADIRAWVAEWRKQSGKQLIYVYVGRADLLGACKPSDWMDANTRLIAARYYTNNRVQAWANLGFDNAQLDITQYWNQASVPGAAGLVDVNVARRIVTQEDDMTPDQDNKLTSLWNAVFFGGGDAGPESIIRRLENLEADPDSLAAVDRKAWTRDQINALTADMATVKSAVTALQDAVTKGDADLLAAIRAGAAGQIDVPELASRLQAALGEELAGEVAAEFAKRLEL